jgi:DNA-binding NarL/FixJ family response regulator
LNTKNNQLEESGVSIRILLADDHRIMRDGLRALIEKQPGMEVVAEAENAQGAIELAHELAIKVIGLSMYSDKQFVQGMFKAGALGYLLKDCAFEELARAIHLVVAGQIYLCPGIEDPAAPESG